MKDKKGFALMQIARKDIKDLLPSDYNPRQDLTPGDKEYEKLKKSIQEFDYIDPIIWNKRTSTVVGGHQRLKVLKDLGHTEIDVSVVDLPLAEEMALNVALNKVSGDWDTSKLSDLMLELQDMDIDMELTGFDLEEINDLLPIGMESIDTSDEFSLPDGDKEPFQQMTFTLADDQAELIKDVLKKAKNDIIGTETFGNENSNGNALYKVVLEWEEQRT